MLRTRAELSARLDLLTLCEKTSQRSHVFVIDYDDIVLAERAYLAPTAAATTEAAPAPTTSALGATLTLAAAAETTRSIVRLTVIVVSPSWAALFIEFPNHYRAPN